MRPSPKADLASFEARRKESAISCSVRTYGANEVWMWMSNVGGVKGRRKLPIQLDTQK